MIDRRFLKISFAGQNIEMIIVPKQTKSIPIVCSVENFSFRKTIPRITAIIGLIEDIGVAREVPINSNEVKNVTAPNPQLRIPVKPKINPSRIDILSCDLIFSLDCN